MMLAAAYCDPGIIPKQVEIATNLARKYTSESNDIEIPDKTIAVQENAIISKWCGKNNNIQV